MKKIIAAIEYQEAYAARDIQPIDVFNALTNFAPHKIIGVYEVFRDGNVHICTDCGREDDNVHSTSLCRECQLVLMLNLADDSEKSAQQCLHWTAGTVRLVESYLKSKLVALSGLIFTRRQ